jgi:hypothetical protein
MVGITRELGHDRGDPTGCRDERPGLGRSGDTCADRGMGGRDSASGHLQLPQGDRENG